MMLHLQSISTFSKTCAFEVQGFFWQFWEGALGPLRLGKLAM